MILCPLLLFSAQARSGLHGSFEQRGVFRLEAQTLLEGEPGLTPPAQLRVRVAEPQEAPDECGAQGHGLFGVGQGPLRVLQGQAAGGALPVLDQAGLGERMELSDIASFEIVAHGEQLNISGRHS